MTEEELIAAIADIDRKIEKRENVSGYAENVAALIVKRDALQSQLDALGAE